MIIKNGENTYQVTDQLAEDLFYRTYWCKPVGAESQCLLLIATEAAHNGNLSRNAFMLQELEQRSRAIEAEWASSGLSGSNYPLNYCLGFPELVDNFVFHEQGGRRVNIIGFRYVENLDVVPISRMVEKDRLRVDLKTSSWILGRLLKTLIFTQSEGIASGEIEPGNILLQLDRHYVILSHWGQAQPHSDGVPADIQQQEVQQAARAVVIALGGDPDTGFIPNDGEEHFERYTQHLLGLARGSARCAQEAYEAFYKLVDALWERKFHSFKTSRI